LYLLQTEEMQSQLVGRASGTTVIGIKQSELRKAEVRLPSVSEQREVASTLKALDDRIDNLRQPNAMLEAIAAALFKSWFVDFDGIAPEDMQESELGLIPKGWRVGGLEELLVLQRGFDLPVQNRIEGEYPVIAAGGINGTHHEAMVKGPGVVTGRSGVLGNVFLALGDFWPLNTTLWIKEFRAATPCFAYELLRRFDFGVFNAGSAVPTLNRNHVHGLPQFIPPPEKVVKFEDIAISLHQRAAQNSRQAATLTTLRDSLLPRLISGQLRVGKAEGLLDNAAHPRSAP
jgi:type I restriction enzyme S subunit